MNSYSENICKFSPPISLKPKGLGKRHILAFLGFVGFALSYSLRFNLSIAIVAMCNDSNSREIHTPQVVFQRDICSSKNKNDHYIHQGQGEDMYKDETTYLKILLPSENFNSTVLPPDTDTFVNIFNEPEGEFNWSKSEQGFILGSFFWGYICTQIPGGWLGHRFGGKRPFGIGLLVTGLLAIATPLAAKFGGFFAIVFIRVLQGLFGGITMPSMHCLLAKWIPPDERGRFSAIVYAGMPFGNAASLIASGYIIKYFGWPMVFYFTGGATVVWYVLWVLLVHSEPSEHPTISSVELKYIQNAIEGSDTTKHVISTKRLPWRSIIKSGPLWAIAFGQLTETWGLYTIMSELPTYMKTVLHYDIQQNSLLSAIPHFLAWACSIFVTQLGDFCISRHYLSIGTTRKICNTLGMWGAGAALLGVAYSGCDRTSTVILLSIGVAATGGIYGGVLVNLIDITPHFAGLLMGFTNTFGSIPGVLAPWVAGYIIDKDTSLHQWKLVFMITSAIYVIGSFIFLLFASGEEQFWNNFDDKDQDPDSEVGSRNHGIEINTNQRMEMDITAFHMTADDIASYADESVIHIAVH